MLQSPASETVISRGEFRLYSIGEFSKITGLTVKTLRFYHEQGLLVPSRVDEQSGYRYYSQSKVETARVVSRLRQLEFSLGEVAEILQSYDDQADILDYLERQRQAMGTKLRHFRQLADSLDQIMAAEREARKTMSLATYNVEVKTLEDVMIAAIRMKGRYSECGQAFAKIGKQFGRYLCGKPLLLHYDEEYKEEADFEVCMPIRKGVAKDGIEVRSLTGGRCLTLLHKGPYEELGRSYAKILDYVEQNGYQIKRPTREVYLKGPGMIFRGNPKNYLTEIQFPIANATE